MSADERNCGAHADGSKLELWLNEFVATQDDVARSMPELTINTRSPILLLPSKNYSGLEFLLAASILLGTSTITVSSLGTIRNQEGQKNKIN